MGIVYFFVASLNARYAGFFTVSSVGKTILLDTTFSSHLILSAFVQPLLQAVDHVHNQLLLAYS